MTELEQFKAMLDRAGALFTEEHPPYRDDVTRIRITSATGIAGIWPEFYFAADGTLGMRSEITGGMTTVMLWSKKGQSA